LDVLPFPPPQLRYPQRHFSGLGLELAFVVAGSAIDPLRRALVALRSANLIGFRIQ
jgi:hypothetical protein